MNTEKLRKVGSVGDVKLYTYCIKSVKYLFDTGNFDSNDALIKGTYFHTMYWDGGTQVYKGLNYSIIDCQELGNKHIKYIISKKGYEDEAWKYCHEKK